MKQSEKFYYEYEYLARKYANKIHSYENLSYEYDDLLQEFRIKIFLSIKAYGKRWSKYRKGIAPKPVPIKYYLECACGNKMRDFLRVLTRENVRISTDEINLDYGVEMNSFVDADKNIYIVNDVDLLEGLSGKERMVFALYLQGYNERLLHKVYCSRKKRKELKKMGKEPITAKDVIETQKSRIIEKYGNELQRIFKTYTTYELDD